MEMEAAVMVTPLFPKVNLHKEKQTTFTDNVNKQPSTGPSPPRLLPDDDFELTFAASSPVTEAPWFRPITRFYA